MSSQVKTADSKLTVFKTYNPNPKQAEIHRSPATYKALIGAFGSGKSRCGCEHGWKLSRDYPGNVGLICRRDYTTLRDSTMKTFFEMIPKGCELVWKWNETTHDLWLKNQGGPPSMIMFRGADEYHKFGSYELGWFFIDQAEEVKRKVFEMLCHRLRKPNVKHCGVITPNPPNQYHWIYDIFHKNPPDPDDYFVLHTSSYDNKENLPAGYIERLEKMPENWQKMYLHGEFGFMAEGDPVYADFRSGVHISKEPLKIIKNEPIYRSIDFGYRFPAIGWYQYLESKHRVHKLGELVGHNIILDIFCDAALDYERKRFGHQHFKNVGDPAGHQKSDKSERTSIEILKAKGFGDDFISGPAFVKDGLNLIRRMLLVRDDGYPGYLIDSSCKTTEESYLGGYYLKDDQDIPDKDCHPYCDVADTDRYFFMNVVGMGQTTPQEQGFDFTQPTLSKITGG